MNPLEPMGHDSSATVWHRRVSPRIEPHVRMLINLSGTPQPSLTAAKVAGTPSINYGVFLQGTFDFIIIAFVMFIK